jgi:hypothetical protein
VAEHDGDIRHQATDQTMMYIKDLERRKLTLKLMMQLI